MQNFQPTGMVSLEQHLNNLYKQTPAYIIQDKLCELYVDNTILLFIKMWYWPAFIAGISDDVTALFNPKTYSICKV